MGVETVAVTFEVHVLGPVAVFRDGTQVDLRGKPALLVALLVASAGDVVSVDALVDGLWGEDPPATARKAVQVNVSNARSALGAAFPLQTVRGGYLISRDGLRIDADRFLAAVDEAAEVIDDSAESAVELLNDAVGMWRGNAYASFGDNEVLRPEVVRLTEQRVRVKRLLFDARLRLGEHAEIVGDLDAATSEHPYDEDLRRLHMLALYRSGRQTEASRAFDRTRELLLDAGLEPSPELRQLHQQILEQDPSAQQSSASRLEGNLPERRSELIGRAEQIAHVDDLLDNYRLITLTGVGGVGKTSLALEVARTTAATYRDGCWLVELGNVLGDGGVTTEVLSALGIQSQGGATALEALSETLAGLQLLIILDNCEHVLRGAVELTEFLLDRRPDIKIIATSREGLGLRGEYQLTVPSLETRGPDSVAGLLFRQRAAESGWDGTADDSAAIEELCARLDGIPLAIELAAARARSMSVSELSDRLGSRFRLLKGARRGVERHQTLHAMLAWSYDLLDADEQTLFDRLCVFTGPFDLSAAEQVLSDGQLDELSVGDLLGSLVNKSMLTMSAGAFHLLETMRQFSEHQSSGQDLALTRNKHRDYFASFVIEAHDGLLGPEEAFWAQRLETAWPNVRVAFEWAIETGDTNTALTIVAHLGNRLFNNRHALEVLRWAEAAIELPGSEEDPLYTSGLAAAATVLAMSGDLENAQSLAQRAVAACVGPQRDFDQLASGSLALVRMISGQLDDAVAILEERIEAGAGSHPTLRSKFLEQLAVTQVGDWRTTEGFATAELALALARETGNPSALASALQAQGMAIESEEPVQALRLFDESLAVSHAASLTSNVNTTRQRKAHVLMDMGRPADALQLALETGWFLLRRGAQWVASDSVFVCARALEAMGDPHNAALLYGAALWADPTGLRGPRRKALRAQLIAALGEAAAAEFIEDGRALNVQQALDLADAAADVSSISGLGNSGGSDIADEPRASRNAIAARRVE